MKSIVVCFCFCCLGFWSHALSAQEQVRVLRPLEQCTPVTDLNDRIEEVKAIPLQRHFDPQSQEWFQKKLLITPKGDFLLVYGSEVLCFDDSGKYWFSMKYDKGEECAFHQDACISVDRKRLLFAHGDSEVVFFDLEDGREVERLPMNKPLRSFEAIAPAPDGGFYYYQVPNPGTNHFKTGVPMLTRFGREGQKLESSVPQVGYTVNAFLVSQSRGNTYLIRTQGGDNACYRVDEKGVLKKAYTVDFGDKGIPDSYGKVNEVLALSDYLRADYYKMPIYFCETAQALYFASCGPGATLYNYLYPREGKSGVCWKGAPEMEIHFFAADDTCFYTIVEPATQELMMNTQDPLLKRILGQIALSSLQKPSAYLVRVKFK